jgi:DNA ligase-1
LPFSALDTILHRPLSEWLTSSLPALLGEPPELRIAQLEDWLRRLPLGQRFVLLKLITGAFRVGVSQKLMAQGLGRAFELAPSLLADRLVGGVGLSAMDFEALVDPVSGDTDSHRPYPFFLASPLAAEPDTLGSPAEWLAEWKWDGIRAQLIRRDQAILWSRGEERLDGRFPEIEAAAVALPAGCVLDGEILAWRDDAPLPFQHLQRRIGRRKPGARLLNEVPLRFLAYDLLEFNGIDLRAEALRQRRQRLQLLIPPAANGALGLSPGLPFEQWHTLAQLRDSARERGVEGLMIKRLDSPYRRGRKRGDWWKWKLEPLSIDAVLIYAQAGHGRRANLYTDYSFALWDGDRLVPVAKAYSGLDDAEIQRLDRWIRSHTVERFGPVRSVTPELVFELGFEAVQASTRHKSGVAVRFPRILRWREDKRPEQADTLTALKSLAGLQPSTA